MATIAGYWLWFLYLKYLKMESEASKEVTFKYLKYPKYLKYLKMESEASKEVTREKYIIKVKSESVGGDITF